MTDRVAPKVPGINAQPLRPSIGFTPNRVSRKQRHPAHDKRKSARSAKPTGGKVDRNTMRPTKWDDTPITMTRLRRVCRAYGVTMRREGELVHLTMPGEAAGQTILLKGE